MRQALVVFLVLCLIAWLEFAYFPGHSYLLSGSQVYVAALEHLQAPGFLSRDLAITHPNFGLTVYDELTLLLVNLTRSDIHHILLAEHFLARAAGLFGLFLLARALGSKIWHAVAIAALLNLGTWLPGPDIWLFDPEPVPRAFAFGLLLLAIGLFGRAQNLLASFFGGCALLFDPAFSAPFWIALMLIYLFDRRLRPLIRPLAPVLLVFILLLANLAQLQQGTPDSAVAFSRLPLAVARIDQFRSPELWVTLWPGKLVYLYLALFTLSIWALTRSWPILTNQMRWLFALLPAMGVLTLPLSALLVDRLRLQPVVSSAPLRLLSLSVVLTWILCAAAALRAFYNKRALEAAAWATPVILLFLLAIGHPYRKPAGPDVQALAAWARANTWGSSVFLFPDDAKSSIPGRFRAESLRALWVDWAGGAQVIHDPAIAPEWFARWQSSMQNPLSAQHLEALLTLPIDYFVLHADRILEAQTPVETRRLKPVFRDDHFAVYEASGLRIAPGTLLVDGR